MIWNARPVPCGNEQRPTGTHSEGACRTVCAGRALLFLLVVGLLAVGCQSQSESVSTGPAPRSASSSTPIEKGAYFVDVAKRVGIDFEHSMADAHLSNVMETMGSGAAFLDYDQDGFLDLYVANYAHSDSISNGSAPDQPLTNHLYRSRAGSLFVDATQGAGVGAPGRFTMGVAVADYDNDGDPDIYLCNYGENILYRNEGDGTFTNVTADAGVAGADSDNSISAVWLDYNNDGALDLYVGNYLEFDSDYHLHYQPDGFPPPTAYPPQQDRLYRNNGDGTFTEVTKETGLKGYRGHFMGAASADFNDDGYADLYVTNDATANYLFYNEGGTEFREMADVSGMAFNQRGQATSSMAADWADFNRDGRLDLFVSDANFNSLYRNDGAGLTFTDVTVQSGIAEASGQYVAWGASFLDYDNDGDVDIFKVNAALRHSYGHQDQIFENVGDTNFRDVSLELGSYFKREAPGRGAAAGDYDNDGDVDLLINCLDAPPVLLRNQGLDENHWLEVLLVGTKSNRDGVGAEVTVSAGDLTQTAVKESASGYMSTNSPRLHFGLGSHQQVDSLRIEWPSGQVQVLRNLSADQILTVTEGQSAARATEIAKQARP